ncbi:MAG: hypothetical protein MSC31_03040 [Solirubrobacteraceae bacterium MAG38_C4-C5]|nr:hypothetical protein [Candidatus Siliceabacter maunaloa]
MAGEDPEEQLEHDTEELDQRIDRVEAHIDESRDKLKARQEDADEIDEEEVDDSEAEDGEGGDPAGFDDPEEVDELDVDEEA